MLGQSTPVKSFPSHAIYDPNSVDRRADSQLMTREHYYYYNKIKKDPVESALGEQMTYFS